MNYTRTGSMSFSSPPSSLSQVNCYSNGRFYNDQRVNSDHNTTKLPDLSNGQGQGSYFSPIQNSNFVTSDIGRFNQPGENMRSVLQNTNYMDSFNTKRDQYMENNRNIPSNVNFISGNFNTATHQLGNTTPSFSGNFQNEIDSIENRRSRSLEDIISMPCNSNFPINFQDKNLSVGNMDNRCFQNFENERRMPYRENFSRNIQKQGCMGESLNDLPWNSNSQGNGVISSEDNFSKSGEYLRNFRNEPTISRNDNFHIGMMNSKAQSLRNNEDMFYGNNFTRDLRDIRAMPNFSQNETVGSFVGSQNQYLGINRQLAHQNVPQYDMQSKTSSVNNNWYQSYDMPYDNTMLACSQNKNSVLDAMAVGRSYAQVQDNTIRPYETHISKTFHNDLFDQDNGSNFSNKPLDIKQNTDELYDKFLFSQSCIEEVRITGIRNGNASGNDTDIRNISVATNTQRRPLNDLISFEDHCANRNSTPSMKPYPFAYNALEKSHYNINSEGAGSASTYDQPKVNLKKRQLENTMQSGSIESTFSVSKRPRYWNSEKDYGNDDIIIIFEIKSVRPALSTLLRGSLLKEVILRKEVIENDSNQSSGLFNPLVNFLNIISSNEAVHFQLSFVKGKLCLKVNDSLRFAEVIISLIEQYLMRNDFERMQMFYIWNKSMDNVLKVLQDKTCINSDNLQDDPRDIDAKIQKLKGKIRNPVDNVELNYNQNQLITLQLKLLLLLYSHDCGSDDSLSCLYSLKKQISRSEKSMIDKGIQNPSLSNDKYLEFLYHYNNVFVPYEPKDIKNLIDKYCSKMVIKIKNMSMRKHDSTHVPYEKFGFHVESRKQEFKMKIVKAKTSFIKITDPELVTKGKNWALLHDFFVSLAALTPLEAKMTILHNELKFEIAAFGDFPKLIEQIVKQYVGRSDVEREHMYLLANKKGYSLLFQLNNRLKIIDSMDKTAVEYYEEKLELQKAKKQCNTSGAKDMEVKYMKCLERLIMALHKKGCGEIDSSLPFLRHLRHQLKAHQKLAPLTPTSIEKSLRFDYHANIAFVAHELPNFPELIEKYKRIVENKSKRKTILIKGGAANTLSEEVTNLEICSKESKDSSIRVEKQFFNITEINSNDQAEDNLVIESSSIKEEKVILSVFSGKNHSEIGPALKDILSKNIDMELSNLYVLQRFLQEIVREEPGFFKITKVDGKELIIEIGCFSEHASKYLQIINQFLYRTNLERAHMFYPSRSSVDFIYMTLKEKLQELNDLNVEPLKICEQLASLPPFTKLQRENSKKLLVCLNKLVMSLSKAGYGPAECLENIIDIEQWLYDFKMKNEEQKEYLSLIPIEKYLTFIYCFNDLFVPYVPKNLLEIIEIMEKPDDWSGLINLISKHMPFQQKETHENQNKEVEIIATKSSEDLINEEGNPICDVSEKNVEVDDNIVPEATISIPKRRKYKPTVRERANFDEVIKDLRRKEKMYAATPDKKEDLKLVLAIRKALNSAICCNSYVLFAMISKIIDKYNRNEEITLSEIDDLQIEKHKQLKLIWKEKAAKISS